MTSNRGAARIEDRLMRMQSRLNGRGETIRRLLSEREELRRELTQSRGGVDPTEFATQLFDARQFAVETMRTQFGGMYE